MSGKIRRLFIILLSGILIFVPVQIFASESTEEVNTYYLGSVVNTGKDNGYSEKNEITEKDPHYGWSLGSFSLSGYTSQVEEDDGNIVFLKNVGDTVTLWFDLEQDIDELNGDSDLSISDDANGYDSGFQVDKTDFGRGTLIVRKTDYQNNTSDPEIYTDYLSGVVMGANTQIDVYEEGDYEVALDYEIRNKKASVFGKTLVSSYTNYRIYFKFSVRNGNCMVFPFDSETGEELSNKAITKNGFYLDLANSRYLDINIKKEVLNESEPGLAEDVRFNSPATDGEEYTEEGIYTITVSNKYTEEETVKTIYVGTNDILKAYVATGFEISDIEELVDEGATINDDGTMNAADAGGKWQSAFVGFYNKVIMQNPILILGIVFAGILVAVFCVVIAKRKKGNK